MGTDDREAPVRSPVVRQAISTIARAISALRLPSCTREGATHLRQSRRDQSFTGQRTDRCVVSRTTMLACAAPTAIAYMCPRVVQRLRASCMHNCDVLEEWATCSRRLESTGR